jgi:hypothetical protein
MARLRLEQLLSNMTYNSGSNNLIISGSAEVVSTPTQTGSLTIQDVDTFGDSGSFFTLDLGDY